MKDTLEYVNFKNKLKVDELINDLKFYGANLNDSAKLSDHWFKVTIPLILRVTNAKQHELNYDEIDDTIR